MQVFNSFQEMAVGTGALGAQSTMSVFNALSPGWEKSNRHTEEIRNITNWLDEYIQYLDGGNYSSPEEFKEAEQTANRALKQLSEQAAGLSANLQSSIQHKGM